MAQFTDQVLHTFEKFSRTWRDAVHNGSPAMSAMRRHGAIKKIKVSGTKINPTVLKDATNNLTHFRGKQRLQHVAEEPFDAPSYKWYYLAYKGALALTDGLENSGREQIIDRMSSEMKKGRIYFGDRLNKNIVKLQSTNATGFGESTAEIHEGIPDIVHVDAGAATVTNTLGGITRNTGNESWFQNQALDITNTNVLAQLELLLQDCTRSGVRPSVWLMGKIAHNIIVNLGIGKLQVNQLASAKPQKFQAGFSGVMMHGAEVVWDHEIVEDSTIGNTADTVEGVAYAMSTDFWNYIEGAPWGFKMLPWKEPDGGSEIMAREFTILAARAHYHELPRTCGVGHGIDY